MYYNDNKDGRAEMTNIMLNERYNRGYCEGYSRGIDDATNAIKDNIMLILDNSLSLKSKINLIKNYFS